MLDKHKNHLSLLVLSLFSVLIFSQTKKEGIKLFENTPNFTKLTDDAIFNLEFQFNNNHSFKAETNQNDAGLPESKLYKQYYKGLQVEFGEVIMHNFKGSQQSMSYSVFDLKNITINPKINSQQALNKAIEHVGANEYLWEDPQQMSLFSDYQKPEGTLLILPQMDGLINKTSLAYKFDIYALNPVSRANVYIDANTGDVLFVNSTIYHVDGPSNGESLYNGNVNFIAENIGGSFRLRQNTTGGGVNTFNLNGSTNYAIAQDITSNSSNFGGSNRTGIQAHWGAEQTYDYFFDKHDRRSYDNLGSQLVSYINYSTNYANAFWSGEFMTYGDGGGGGALVSLDIVGHEITHGVTQNSANLIYAGESGALNESFSDIFGEAIEYYVLGSTNWLLGDDLSDGAFRSLIDPQSKGSPDCYQGRLWNNPNCGTPNGSNDNCGVHFNSGVQNFWFYLLSDGGQGINDLGNAFKVEGIGIEKAAEIAYRNLTQYLTSSSGFQMARNGAIQSAIDIFGEDSQEQISVTNAWYAVGLGLPYFNEDEMFVTTWKTDNSQNNQITIPAEPGLNYDYLILWGDGNFDIAVSSNITHTYSWPGSYEIRIYGDFPRINFSDHPKIISIDQWGANSWVSMENAFNGCSNLNLNATDLPNLSRTSSLLNMFSGCSSLVANSSIDQWDTSNITNTEGMFNGASKFNQALKSWNLSKVTTFENMFNGASSFNQDISNWDTSFVVNMAKMFSGATNFNQPIANWNTSKVNNMFAMFKDATDFNQSIGNWDVSKVVTLESIFNNAIKFDQDLGQWNVELSQNFSNMFLNGMLSTSNYDSLINGWVKLTNIKATIEFNAGSSFYCHSKDSRQKLIDDLQWIIIDAGPDISPPIIVCKNITVNLSKQNLVVITADDVNGGSAGGCGEVFLEIDKSSFTDLDLGDNEVVLTATDINGNQTKCTAIVTVKEALLNIKSFTLINANTNEPILEIIEGAEININDLPTNFLNIKINASSDVESLSVEIQDTEIFDGETTTLPFSFYGYENDQYNSHIFKLGTYIIKATPFNNKDLKGEQGDTFSLRFKFIGNEPAKAFVTTWTTSNQGDSNNNQISIPINTSETYNYHVFWGDSKSDSNIDDSITHTYSEPGTYTVAIYGDFPALNFNNGGDKLKINTIEQWGDTQWGTMENSFNGCDELIINAIDIPNLNNVESLAFMFKDCTKIIGNKSINSWNTKSIITMEGMFSGAENFNGNISRWNVENVTNMSYLFESAASFNQDISAWNIGKVTQTIDMFKDASIFNQNLGTWNVGSITNMSGMFTNTGLFNQDLSKWNVDTVNNMDLLFAGCQSFDQDLSSWNIGNVSTFIDMFRGVTLSIDNYDKLLIEWNKLETLQPNAMFSAGNSQFCTGEISRQNLIDNHGWLIIDEGSNSEKVVALCKNVTLALDKDGNATLIPSDIDGGSVGGCNKLSFSLSKKYFTTDDIGDNEVTLFVKSVNGLEAFCNTIVTIIELPEPPIINSFYLINGDDNEDIMIIENNTIIDLRDMPTENLNIRALTSDGVNQIEYNLSGANTFSRTSKNSPFHLFETGSKLEGEKLTIGTYSLEAIAFQIKPAFKITSEINAISFEVIDKDPPIIDHSEPNFMIIYPNEASTNTTLSFVRSENIYMINIYDISGKLSQSHNAGPQLKSDTYNLDVSTLSAGTYIVKAFSIYGQNFESKLLIHR